MMAVIPQQSIYTHRNSYKSRLPNLQIVFKYYEILMMLNLKMEFIYFVMGNKLNMH